MTKIYVEKSCLTSEGKHLKAQEVLELDEKKESKLFTLKLVVKFDPKVHKKVIEEQDTKALEAEVAGLKDANEALEAEVAGLKDAIGALDETANAGEIKKAVIDAKAKVQ